MLLVAGRMVTLRYGDVESPRRCLPVAVLNVSVFAMGAVTGIVHSRDVAAPPWRCFSARSPRLGASRRLLPSSRRRWRCSDANSRRSFSKEASLLGEVGRACGVQVDESARRGPGGRWQGPDGELGLCGVRSQCASLPASFMLSVSTAPKYDGWVRVRDVESAIALRTPSVEARS